MAAVARVAGIWLLIVICACDQGSWERQSGSRRAAPELNDIAEAYVKTALSFGELDKSYVDAYYGPEQWRHDAQVQQAPISAVRRDAQHLLRELGDVDTLSLTAIELQRHAALTKRVAAMLLRMDMSEGHVLPFDEESRILFDATAPNYSPELFEETLAKLDALVPGEGALADRIDSFRKHFVIPREKLDIVFRAAIDECRARTLRYIDLPDNESFVLEYVTDQPWSGYNWYKGNGFSLIQINTDLPIYISRALELGCHEGYPGHHTLNVLLEQKLVKERGWIEYTLNPLYGPQSLISEGSANFGIGLAFPGTQRRDFEKSVLFRLAGLDPNEADRYYEVRDLLAELTYAGNEAARDYLNGEVDEAAAIDWLVSYTLSSPERAAQRIQFFDTYRSYVINYNLGSDLVGSYIDAMAGDDVEARWAAFEKLLSSPLTPSDLRIAIGSQ